MSKYKLTFRLKQHTPMIHFQADQHGATLRASELKPKLDRFIIDQIGLTKTVVVKGENKEIQRDEFKDWFISEQHLALDYQVKIKATNIKKNVIHNGSDKVPNFFANIGDNYKDVYLTKADQIFVEIIVMNQSLKEKIDSYFGQFLLGTNFGMRQSKGFGSYSLENHPFESTDFDLSFDIDTSQIPSNLWRRRNGLFEDWHHELQLFGAIEIFYKSLRSGINRKGPNQVPIFYIKPAIFYFAMQVLKK
ncbi:MAG: hypothetical protein MI810_16760, partial [Flavobacteriales bacterium]|nr:hypothetical protein [Flavobacteriales bacterium]